MSIRPLAVAALLASGCKNEQGLVEARWDSLAVVTGDFDHMEEVLDHLAVDYVPYDGYIFQAAYDQDIKPDALGLESESLYTGQVEGQPEIDLYDAIFINSGARGFGAYVYNSLDSDDSVLKNQASLDQIRAWVEAGGNLVVSDWAYDLVEALWPDAIDFARDDTVVDDAQCGTSERVSASVLGDEMQAALDGVTEVELVYDYSYWTPIEAVDAATDVYLRGDVTWRQSAAEGEVSLEDAPLLVGFDAGAGRVIFSTFHWRAQTPAVAEGLMLGGLKGLRRGATVVATPIGGEGA